MHGEINWYLYLNELAKYLANDVSAYVDKQGDSIFVSIYEYGEV